MLIDSLCVGLYRGYKLRNAKLDSLSANPPAYLADPKISLSSRTFEDVDTRELCQEIHDYLFLKFQLLDRVIRARKLHHSRFFSMDMDYGHEKFLDVLQGQKATIAKALERLEHRTAEVMYSSYSCLGILLTRHRSFTKPRNGSTGSEDVKQKRKRIGRRSKRR
jgi:hypothetical protein